MPKPAEDAKPSGRAEGGRPQRPSPRRREADRPPGGTAIHAALAAGTTIAVAAAEAVKTTAANVPLNAAERFRLIGQYGVAAVFIVACGFMYGDWREERRDADRYQRTDGAAQSAALVAAVNAQTAAVGKLEQRLETRAAIDETMAAEMRASRVAIELLVREFRSASLRDK